MAAARVIDGNGRHVRKGQLDQALKLGKKRKESYYRDRVAAGSSRSWVYRQVALAAQKKNEGILSWDDIDLLTEASHTRKNEATDEFLTNSLHAGLLAQDPEIPDHYRIPIPSMGDYLRGLSAKPPSSA